MQYLMSKLVWQSWIRDWIQLHHSIKWKRYSFWNKSHVDYLHLSEIAIYPNIFSHHLDHDECEENGMCANGKCINMDGSFKCQCHEGFVLSASGHSCIGIFHFLLISSALNFVNNPTVKMRLFTFWLIIHQWIDEISVWYWIISINHVSFNRNFRNYSVEFARAMTRITNKRF